MTDYVQAPYSPPSGEVHKYKERFLHYQRILPETEDEIAAVKAAELRAADLLVSLLNRSGEVACVEIQSRLRVDTKKMPPDYQEERVVNGVVWTWARPKLKSAEMLRPDSAAIPLSAYRAMLGE